MPLPLRKRLTMLVPPSVFYRQRIAQEARTGEPELAVLAELVPRGGIAVDIGANVGFFAYALADIADRVIAFEPNPDYAFFARWMLRGRAEVREIALSDASGRGTLYVPLSDRGMLLHLAGSLKRSHVQFRHIKTFDVEIRTLDEAGLAGVRFVKADVEGGEREVLDGARATIARDRPIILLELLSGTHENPAADVAAICESFGYEAFIVQHGERIAALPAIFALGHRSRRRGGLRHSKVTDGLPLSGEERSCGGHRSGTGFDPNRTMVLHQPVTAILVPPTDWHRLCEELFIRGRSWAHRSSPL
jgi:FkbM family methyltransferase